MHSVQHINHIQLTYSGQLTHISGHPSATGRAQDGERTLSRDWRSAAEPCGHNTIICSSVYMRQCCARCSLCGQKSVYLISVYLSFRHMLCDRTKNSWNILIPWERSVPVVFWHQPWLVTDIFFNLKSDQVTRSNPPSGKMQILTVSTCST